jgi:hypothetical protein
MGKPDSKMSSWFELAVMFKNNRSSDYKKETTWLLFLFEENVVQPTFRKKTTLDLNLELSAAFVT